MINTTSFSLHTVLCPNLVGPENGMLTQSNGNSFNSTTTYECNRGYELSDSTPRTCLADGTWTGADPTCDLSKSGEIIVFFYHSAFDP